MNRNVFIYKKIMIKGILAFVGVTSILAPVSADTISSAGIYLGIEGGWDTTGWKRNADGVNDDGILIKIKNDAGLVGRVFFGYDFNKYFGLEAGYTYFANTATLAISQNVVAGDCITEKTQVADLLGKITVPLFKDILSVYAKAGVSYMMTNRNVLDNPVSRYVGLVINGHYYTDIFTFASGLGINYTISHNVIANAEWLRYAGNESYYEMRREYHGNFQPAANAFMIGIKYKFNL